LLFLRGRAFFFLKLTENPDSRDVIAIFGLSSARAKLVSVRDGVIDSGNGLRRSGDRLRYNSV
jgi:hypothetical protein